MDVLSQLHNVNSKKPCPLCQSNQISHYFEDKFRQYQQCNNCELVFVPKVFWLSNAKEKSRYDLHQNSEDDTNYVQFLERIIAPLKAHLIAEQKQGLDFGSGPSPVLAKRLSDRGYQINTYDKFYQTDKSPLKQSYDFITTTEVVEHLQQPHLILEQLWQMLKHNGTLAIMTKMVIDKDAFSRWHYKNDDTHIIFFSQTTFNWLAKKWNAKAHFYGNDIVILKKGNP
jgi:2-polyprenyl-3-methyl-5-hydroxy-6-metoxy-1,4-benzoquinol methylase